MQRNHYRPNRPHNRQKGIVLVTAILLLVALTILLISMMRTSIVEERMVGSSRDWNNAFQAAEAALRDAEREIAASTRISGTTGFDASCTNGLCLPNTCPSNSDCSPVWVKLDNLNDTAWLTGSGTSSTSVAYGTYTPAVSLPGFSAQPRYIVEVLNTTSKSLKPSWQARTLYRVTAVGFGLNNSTRVMLQSTVSPPQ